MSAVQFSVLVATMCPISLFVGVVGTFIMFQVMNGKVHRQDTRYYEVPWAIVGRVVRRMVDGGYTLQALHPTDGIVKLVFAR